MTTASTATNTIAATTLKIAAAALLHDVGKLMQPAVEETLPAGTIQPLKELYLPTDQHQRPTHTHAAYTAYFFEEPHIKEMLPAEFTESGWGDGEAEDTCLGLAARHHKPSTPLQWIIAEADRLSAAHDRRRHLTKEQQTAPKDYLGTRLYALLPLVTTREAPPTIEGESVEPYVLPLRWNDDAPIIPEPHRHPAGEKERARTEYKAIFHKFVAALNRIAETRDNPALWLRLCTAQYQYATSLLPATRAGLDQPNVSLYDHSHIAAAVAVALYRYHAEADKLTVAAVKERTPQKFLFIRGAFRGIQKFIFDERGVTQKGRAKLLRGRSLYVQLLSECAALLLCEELGLPHTSVLLSTAGKFDILAPNSPSTITAIARTQEKIRAWLLRETFGLVHCSLVSAAAAPEDLVYSAENENSPGLRPVFDSIAQQELIAKFEPFAIEQYGGVVDTFFTDDAPPGLSRLNEDHITLGRYCLRDKCLSISSADAVRGGYRGDPGTHVLEFPIFDKYRVTISDKSPSLDLDNLQVSLWETRSTLHVPTGKNGEVLTFNDIAHNGPLAALKLDVDNLGQLWRDGFANVGDTLSQRATFARHLDQFFSKSFPFYCANEPSLELFYTLFSGGDDLFVIGPWWEIIKGASFIHDRFSRYTAGNPDLHFSASITLVDPHAPLNVIGPQAEEGLSRAKAGSKNRLFTADCLIPWDRLLQLIADADRYCRYVEGEDKIDTKPVLSHGDLRKLWEITNLAVREQELTGNGAQRQLASSDLDAIRWRASLAHLHGRRIGSTSGERRIALDDVLTHFTNELHLSKDRRQIAATLEWALRRLRNLSDENMSYER